MKKFKLYNLLVPALISLLVLAFASYTNTYSQNTGNFIDNIGSKFDDDDKSGLNVQLPDPTPDNDIKDPSDLSHETLPDEISESQQEQEPSNAENNDKSEKTETSEVSNSNKGTGKNNNVDTQPDTDKQIYYEEIQAYKELIYYKDEALERYINYKAKNPDYSYEKVITYVNAGIDQKFYENIKIIENGYDLTVLVNKFNKLPDNFKPDLVRLDDSHCAEGRGPQYLHKTAADAFVKMREDAKLLGLDITAYGTYRSVETQHRIWNNAVNSGRTIEDVDSLNARGGHSEHHTGLAVDVIKNNYSVEQTKEFEWYSKNAHKYGFIIRYPKGKEYITGYKYEPWHLRYVGDIAKEIYESGLTYEEYYVTRIEPYR